MMTPPRDAAAVRSSRVVTEVGRVRMLNCLWLIGQVFLPWRSDPDGGPEEHSASRRGILAALVLLALLIFVSLHIITALRTTDALQDCVMQGRTNCSPAIRAPSP
ncbi:hypothetical protein ACELLULO517_03385 [Acidisoma cellulosilytica]|uniref:Uncharacterized protein n=1 Tax=Acidisoma cellulosilyticum TaxID=2802395 RepID=A0A963YYE6_9PROT|nr:hypothetical protein [Acidisoma cellulosilyticum]MCB8879265.1 hypothetical protein [Acidisoma cellulosilyticum]